MADTAKSLLRELYDLHGPRGDDSQIMAPDEFAKLKTGFVENKWDFEDRHLMHRVARVLTGKR